MSKTKPITDVRRALMFQVMQGDQRVGYFLMIAHKHKLCDDILHLLINRGIVGPAVIEWLNTDHKGNIVQAVASLAATVEKLGAGGYPMVIQKPKAN